MKFLSAAINLSYFVAAMASCDNGDDLAKADQWLAAKNLNEFGDAKDTMYMGGSPLFNEMTGEMTSRCDYLKKKFPAEPWKESGALSAAAVGGGAAADLSVIDTWLETKDLNKYGDPKDTMYMGGSPLFNEMTGESKTRVAHLLEKFPARPWDSGDDL